MRGKPGKEGVQKEWRGQEEDACAKLLGIIAHVKEKGIDYLKLGRKRKPKRVVIWILREISLVGTEFGGGSRGPSCPGKSSPTDFPLSDHMTLPSINVSYVWKRKGGPVRQGSSCP